MRKVRNGALAHHQSQVDEPRRFSAFPPFKPHRPRLPSGEDGLSLKPNLRAALHWDRARPINLHTVAIAALSIGVPVLLGLVFRQPGLGFTIGLGALLLTDAASAPAAGNAPAEKPAPGSAIPVAAAATVIATLIGGSMWADAVMIALAGVAAAASGYSRPVGVAAIRFIIYLVLSVTLLEAAGEQRPLAALTFGLGALWNVIIRILLHRRKTATEPAPPPAAPTRKPPTPAQLRAHWRRTMATLAGWQFPIRIVAGLSVACLLRRLWPGHHYTWIVLTVALLTQRPLEHLPVKIVQRAVGAGLGVALTWAVLVMHPGAIVLAGLIVLLGAGAGIARARNYLAYAVLSTPVILLVLDIGWPVEMSLLTDRLAATVIGALIVVAGNVAMERVTASFPPA